MQPIQQQGRRTPSLSSVRALSTCCLRVSGFFTEIVQHIHSLRASGVRSSHAASASASEARVSRTSSGKSWTTPPEICVLVMYKAALSRKDCRSEQRLQSVWLIERHAAARRASAAPQTLGNAHRRSDGHTHSRRCTLKVGPSTSASTPVRFRDRPRTLTWYADSLQSSQGESVCPKHTPTLSWSLIHVNRRLTSSYMESVYH